MFLVDIARYKENTLPLNIFDSSKKVSLDFLCITADTVSYADPGVIRVYDVGSCSINHQKITSKCNPTHTGLAFSLKKWCMLGDVKYLRQISDVHSMTSINDEHCAHLEIQLGDKKIEFCTKTQKINVRL